jgi:hypothetical protein
MSNHAFVSINILPMGLNTKYLLRRFINVLTVAKVHRRVAGPMQSMAGAHMDEVVKVGRLQAHLNLRACPTYIIKLHIIPQDMFR